jgi:hypothetical protein
MKSMFVRTFGFLSKPYTSEQLTIAVQKLLAPVQIQIENAMPNENREGSNKEIGNQQDGVVDVSQMKSNKNGNPGQPLR